MSEQNNQELNTTLKMPSETFLVSAIFHAENLLASGQSAAARALLTTTMQSYQKAKDIAEKELMAARLHHLTALQTAASAKTRGTDAEGDSPTTVEES